MSMHHHSASESEPRPPFWRSKAALVTIVFLAIGAFLLLSEHRAHALGYLPFLLLLACPLMHVFMHGGHGGHGASSGRSDRSTNSSEGG